MGHCYPHPSLQDRREIGTWRDAKMPCPEVSIRLTSCLGPFRVWLANRKWQELGRVIAVCAVGALMTGAVAIRARLT